jgi:hypothetical protein
LYRVLDSFYPGPTPTRLPDSIWSYLGIKSVIQVRPRPVNRQVPHLLISPMLLTFYPE